MWAGCGAQQGLGAGPWRKAPCRWSWQVPQEEVFLLHVDNAGATAALWPLYHWPDAEKASALSSKDLPSCYTNTQHLLCRNTSMAVTASVFPCSSHPSIPSAFPKTPCSPAAQLRGCWPHRSCLNSPLSAAPQTEARTLSTAYTYSTPATTKALLCYCTAWKGAKKVCHGIWLPGSQGEAWGGRKAEKQSQKRESNMKPGSSCRLLFPLAWLE